MGLALYLGLVIIVDGFLNTGLFIPGLEKGSIRYSEVCAAFLLFNRPAASPRRSPHAAVCFFVSLYFSLLLLSAFRSDSLMAGLFEFRRMIVPQIIALLISMRGVRSQEDFRRFFLGVMALSVIVGLFVFFDLFFDRWLIVSDMLYKPEYGVNRQHGRFGSFFINPNYLGAFTVLIFPAAFGSTLNERTRWAKILAWIALLSLAFCLVETQSRGPLLAFGIVLPLLLLGPASGMSRWRRLAIFLPVAAMLVLLMPGFFEHAAERFDELDKEMSTDSARTRETIWVYTKRAIADHPLLGIGFGEQQFVNVITTQYEFEREYKEKPLDNPHNSYLQMTVYAGIPTLFSFVFANWLLLFRSARTILRGLAEQQTHIAFGLAIGITGFLAVIYPDMHMFTQTVAPVYWVFFGLLLSLTTKSEAAPAVERDEDSRANFGSARQHLAGQPTAGSTRYRWDDPRAAAARADRSRDGRAAAPDDAPLWSDARAQQARVPLASVAGPVGVRREDGRGESFPRRSPDRGLTRDAD